MSLSYFQYEKRVGIILYGKSKHTFCVQYFFFENPAIYGIMGKEMFKPGMPQTTMQHMHITSCICKDTNTRVLLLHPNNCYNESPQCNFTRTLPVLFTLPFSASECCTICCSLFTTLYLNSINFVIVSI